MSQLKLTVTVKEYDQIYRLVESTPDMTDAQWIDGLTAILGNRVIVRLLHKKTRIVVDTRATHIPYIARGKAVPRITQDDLVTA